MNVNYNQSAYNDFSFKFKTSSGDSIDLSMYDNKELSFSEEKSKNMTKQRFSLTHAYGYKFAYKGNGIDAQDQKEIDEALKQIQPKLQEFMNNAKNTGIPSPKELLNTVTDIKHELPTPKNDDQKAYLHDNILKLIDKHLQKHFPDEEVLKSAKMLFDKFNEQMRNFSLYV